MSKSIFEVPDKLVEVSVSYAETKNGPVVFFNEKEKENYKGTVKTAKAEFSYESWADFNQTMRSCMIKDTNPSTGAVSTTFDAILLRDKRLRKLLKKLTDGDGNVIEVTDKVIGNMLPDFCVALLDAYNAVIENARPTAQEPEEEPEEAKLIE